MSRGRALLIDASGVLGVLSGFGIDLLIQGEDVEAPPFFTLGLIGMVTGLGLGVYLTDEWDVPDQPIQVGLLPLNDGAGLGFSGSW